ncbi:cytochrome c nitrite reductase, NrfD subunit [Yersinia rohdei]|uniref:Cytochrome c nitrite reductase, NrfD subunit n=1 Tax=Yersinia rohdei TaxID=29485 RepID=A0A0U1HMX3_YERRO|nr:cytochrome c nitrite reductase subunit NrfD [Yersinia rohdei]AJJ10548.1 cytochrome c nitrite reductase, NrfD subunit [Yersinia rohdei]MDN0093325.1 cytochrome c nitrite reductase subunit NrfD [Yersinia rohdei]CNE63856.1 Formate-dependent nitrite reductase%2C membrane component [Yersinia rohdei]CNI74573.1 Formate-dependent nitrite reductase%2C membrane component [Yersinia rohdei]CQI87826.1 Formate-dependent nitrite reductase%2C membrane component [Yersinia rohdei]
MSPTLNTPFHFESLVWDWPIAIYLFLIGVSAGMVVVSLLVKQRVLRAEAAQSGLLKSTAIIAPLAVICGLFILILHLTRPWTFWKLMFFYSPHSVMSLGVMLFQIYMVVLLLWLAVIFRHWLTALLQPYPKLCWVGKVLNWLAPIERKLEPVMMLLAVALGAYTGFLLSALKSYPLLNNPVLPVLFLFSGVSSGIAAMVLCSVVFFKEPVHSPALAFVHRLEKPVVWLELFLLLAFFAGLWFGGGQKEVAVGVALGGGFWALMFWFWVIGCGMVLPMALNRYCSQKVRHRVPFLLMVSGLSLFGVLVLRFFILYAGQMTVV